MVRSLSSEQTKSTTDTSPCFKAISQFHFPLLRFISQSQQQAHHLVEKLFPTFTFHSLFHFCNDMVSLLRASKAYERNITLLKSYLPLSLSISTFHFHKVNNRHITFLKSYLPLSLFTLPFTFLI